MTTIRRRSRLPFGRWLGIGWLTSVVGIIFALLLGGARHNAVLAYVEQYGETAQLRMSDVDRRLDRRIAFWVDCKVSWLPDGETVIYTSTPPRERHQVISLAVFAETRQTLAGDGPYNEAPAVSPDGRYIVYAANRAAVNEIVLLELATGERRVLTRVPVWVSHMRWSADGDRIIIQGIQDNRFARAFVADVGSGDAAQLPDAAAANRSPDQQYLAYTSRQEPAPALYIQALATGNERRVTDGDLPSSLPVWSPDGQAVAFVAGDAGSKQLALYDLAHDEVRMLTPPDFADVALIEWSVDGTRIAFSGRAALTNRRFDRLIPYDIYTVSRAEGDVRMVRRGFGTYINNFSRFCAMAWRP